MNRRQPRPWNKEIKKPSNDEDFQKAVCSVVAHIINAAPQGTYVFEEVSEIDPIWWDKLKARCKEEQSNRADPRITLIQTGLHPAPEQESVLVSETDIVPVGEFRGRYSSTGA